MIRKESASRAACGAGGYFSGVVDAARFVKIADNYDDAATGAVIL